MNDKLDRNVTNGNIPIIGGLGILGASASLAPSEFADLGEPFGLILALIGTALKLIKFFQSRQ